MQLAALPAVLLLALCANEPLYATEQVPDWILLDGKRQSLDAWPLEGYLAGHPEARPAGGLRSTACKRGYVATWEVAGGRLLLRQVLVEAPGPGAATATVATVAMGEGAFMQKDALPELFGGRREVVASWYSGVLLIPEGKAPAGEAAGGGPRYERYTLYVIRDGILRVGKRFSQEGFDAYRKRQFTRFKGTPRYKAVWEEAARRGGDPALWDRILFEVLAKEYLALEPPGGAAGEP